MRAFKTNTGFGFRSASRAINCWISDWGPRAEVARFLQGRSNIGHRKKFLLDGRYRVCLCKYPHADPGDGGGIGAPRHHFALLSGQIAVQNGNIRLTGPREPIKSTKPQNPPHNTAKTRSLEITTNRPHVLTQPRPATEVDDTGCANV